MKHFELVNKAFNNMIMKANSSSINDIWERVRAFFRYGVPLYILDNESLEHIIEIANDWEFCEMHGLLDELSERTNTEFLNDKGEFDESLVDEALTRL